MKNFIQLEYYCEMCLVQPFILLTYVFPFKADRMQFLHKQTLKISPLNTCEHKSSWAFFLEQTNCETLCIHLNVSNKISYQYNILSIAEKANV